jgi:hypothetical protein
MTPDDGVSTIVIFSIIDQRSMTLSGKTCEKRYATRIRHLTGRRSANQPRALPLDIPVTPEAGEEQSPWLVIGALRAHGRRP